MESNTRLPEQVLGDLKSQVFAAMKAARLLGDLACRYGAATSGSNVTITGEIAAGKSLTTHSAPEQGVSSALQAVGFSNENDLRDLRHGSTIVINALIERKAQRPALVTTHGRLHLLRSQLKPGGRIKGPRIILEEGATIMLNNGDTGVVLPSGDLLIEVAL